LALAIPAAYRKFEEKRPFTPSIFIAYGREEEGGF